MLIRSPKTEMSTFIRVFLYIMVFFSAFLGLVACMRVGTDWYIATNHSKYLKEDFILSGRYITHDRGNHFFRGSIKDEEYRFAVNETMYNRYSASDTNGEIIEVYIIPNSMTVTIQGESINAILVSDWRGLEEIKTSAKSATYIAIILFSISLILYMFIKLMLPKLQKMENKSQ